MEISYEEYKDRCIKCDPYKDPAEAAQLLKLAAKYAEYLFQAKKKLEGFKQAEVFIQSAIDLANVVAESNSKKKEPKKKYGEYKNVLLTDKQYTSLTEAFGEAVRDKAIKEVDEYCELHGKKYANCYLAARNYVHRNNAWIAKPKDKPKKNNKEEHSYDLSLIMEHVRNNSPGG